LVGNLGGANDTVNIAGNGRGVAPLGSIIAMTSGFTGAMAVPGSGIVSNGWIRADGSVIPGGNTVSGTTPNLSSSVFLRGNIAYAGTPVGNSTTTLSTANLPAHTHVMDHGHDNTLSVSGTFASSGHTHSHDHVHQSLIMFNNIFVGLSLAQSQVTSFTTGTSLTQSGPCPPGSTSFVKGVASGLKSYTALPIDAAGNGAPNTGGPSGSGSASIAGAVTSMTGSTGNGPGTGTAFSVEPKYIDVIYLMRVN
jgi:hypothetical protein